MVNFSWEKHNMTTKIHFTGFSLILIIKHKLVQRYERIITKIIILIFNITIDSRFYRINLELAVLSNIAPATITCDG